MAIATKPFDVADYLETEADIVAYPTAVLSEGDPALIAKALGTVARARGVSSVARKMGDGLSGPIATGESHAFDPDKCRESFRL